MTDDETPDTELDRADPSAPAEQIGRLQGIKQHLQLLDRTGFYFLSLPNIYDVDPVAQSPYAIPGSFISEEVGGAIAVLDADTEEGLAQENINQMLRNFLPGGYKQRWRNFDLWRGAWHHDSAYGHADIAPMFDWADRIPLTDLLGDVNEVAYTELEFEPANVTVFIPRSMHVERLQKQKVEYAWVEDQGIVWTGTPPGQSQRLSSDPTTNYLWFKHAVGEFDDQFTPVDDSEFVTGFHFDDDRTFIRCYYASLLTLYPRNTTRVTSGLMRYREETEDRTAFVGSEERSQLLTFELDREQLRPALSQLLETRPRLRRDLQFAYLRSLVWERLFFEDDALDHAFQVTPLVEHLVGADYWQRVEADEELGVFPLSGPDLVATVERLLPGNSQTRLRLLGHDQVPESAIVRILRDNRPEVARILALCRNEEKLLDFAEDVLVHSAEHALSGWANELTGSGTAFELWYDVNFQASDADRARIAVYDPIQGGAGIAKEVCDRLEGRAETGVNDGLAAQGRCHSGTADAATISLLGQFPDGTLYDVFDGDKKRFRQLVEETLNDLAEDPDAYSMEDLHSYVDQRVQLLFETRQLARFYSYIAGRYSGLKDALGRTPRPVDIALHLDRHVFRDPATRATYERFASDTGRRDLAELGERLEELTVQCITACPDCLETDGGVCIRGASHQTATLNRRLLTEVFYDA